MPRIAFVPSRLRDFVIVMGLVCAGAEAVTLAQAPSAILLEQRQREVALVRHLRQHVVDPADGLALAADRRDLQRLRAGTPPVPIAPTTPSATDDELVDSLRILVDLWYARLVDRTPFGLMSRERLAGLTQLHQALGQLQSRGGRSGLDLWWPEVQNELAALTRAAQGQGEISDAAVDLALRVADAAATGGPMIGPGPYPVVGPPIGPPSGPGGAPMPGAGPSGPPPGGYGGYPGGGAPLPPSGGPTPYALPPAYEAYGSAAAAGAGGIVACQTLRTGAGVSQSISDMVRASECWTRTPTWPGWGAQSLEALDWATSLAAIERNCTALETAIDSLKELGPRLSAGGQAGAVTAVARRAETDRRRLHGQSLCR
jgi:hypothetical protein